MNRVFLVATLCFLFVSGAAADVRATATVAVNCNAGGRIMVALRRPAVELTIEISGICEEDVEILRSRVTLRGTDPATDGIRPAPDGLKREALELVGVNSINIENLSLAGAFIGLSINATFGVFVDNCLIKDNTFTGVLAGTGSASVTVQDTLITSTAIPPATPSRGIWLANGSSGTCIRCTIENHRTGIRLTNGSFMFLNDSTVRGTERGVDALSASNFASAGNTSTIEGVSQFAIRLLDNSSADFTSDNINGRIRLEKNSVAVLDDTTQLNPSFLNNVVRSGSSLVARRSASLVGNFEITEFSTVTLPAGSTVSGSLFCSLGADAVCEDPSNVSGTSNCGQCPKP